MGDGVGRDTSKMENSSADETPAHQDMGRCRVLFTRQT
jgi:hypothetical protein